MLRLFRLFAPPDAPAGGGSATPTATPTTPSSLGKEDTIEFLGLDDDPADKETIPLGKDKAERETVEDDSIEEEESQRSNKEKKTDGEEDEEEVDELAELEEELEGPTDEQLELMSPVSRREILKKYPNLFKDFPYLERSYYREREYTELLPTIEDAKMAKGKAETLDAFEADVSEGNIVPILQSLHQHSPQKFAKLADNYLTSLAKVDNGAYLHILGNIMRHTIGGMVNEGRKTKNEALVSAAQILNQYSFGSSEYVPPSNMSREEAPNEKDNEVNQREMELNRRQFDETVSTLNDKVNNVLKNTIEANIDPRDSMSDFVRKNAVREVMENLETLVQKDTRFRALTDRLWEAAVKARYSKESTDRIRSAYLAKAKSLLPTVIKKARNEALKGMGKKTERGTDKASSDKRGPITQGRPRSEGNNKVTKASDIPAGMSTYDFLSSD